MNSGAAALLRKAQRGSRGVHKGTLGPVIAAWKLVSQIHLTLIDVGGGLLDEATLDSYLEGTFRPLWPFIIPLDIPCHHRNPSTDRQPADRLIKPS